MQQPTFITIHVIYFFLNLSISLKKQKMSYSNDLAKPAPELCTKCKDMYGHETFNNMCSKCFKTQKAELQILQKKKLDQILAEKQVQIDSKILPQKSNGKSEEKQGMKLGRRETNIPTQGKTQRERTRQKQEKKPQNKCFTCNKKTGMLGYECSHCVNNFCKFHRLPEDHECGVDFITAGKKTLTEANPELKARKISGIDN